MADCLHPDVRCLNQYEYIRKYECLCCHAVMMCACDEAIGRRFLSHQLRVGCELETQERVPVTAGFQPKVCPECRGLPPEAHPKAEIYGCGSKIKRYYWRELAFRRMEIQAELSATQDPSKLATDGREDPASQKLAEKQALQEIKALHARAPRYKFNEESQAEVLRRCGVCVTDLSATYLARREGRKVQVIEGESPVSVEEFTSRHFERLGHSVLTLESRPFHVIFGTYMWLLIQDPKDPRNRIVTFGARGAFEARERGEQIVTSLPADFGTPGYGKRRAKQIDDHLGAKMDQKDHLLWLFDYWLGPSEGLRQYLWAHRAEDVETARKVIEILPGPLIQKLLRYLVEDYWGRQVGWPDLLVHKGADFQFVEVKSSGDRLSGDQKRWIDDNHRLLKVPFSLVKIHKVATMDAG